MKKITTMKKITILGAGAMGSRMAKKLLGAGYEITVFNRTKERVLPLINEGITYIETPVEAVEDADIVISMLTNNQASRHVWLDGATGAIAGLKKGAVAIESGTLSTAWIDELSKEFLSRGTEFLDAPVVGSRPQAESGTLIFLVGGNNDVLEKVKPVLSCMSSSIFHIGPGGSGTRMKLAVNAFFSAQVSVLSELIAVLEKAGLKKKEIIDVFNKLPTTSLALQGIGKLIAANNFDPQFPLALVEKDLRYVLDLASAYNAVLPVTNATRSVIKEAVESGFAEDNIAGVIQLY